MYPNCFGISSPIIIAIKAIKKVTIISEITSALFSDIL